MIIISFAVALIFSSVEITIPFVDRELRYQKLRKKITQNFCDAYLLNLNKRSQHEHRHQLTQTPPCGLARLNCLIKHKDCKIYNYRTAEIAAQKRRRINIPESWRREL